MQNASNFLDLGAWASAIRPVLNQALDPATPVGAHRELAETISEYLEEGALLGDRAADGEAPWRALMVGDACFLALEDGFALGTFDSANLISLRVEAFDGRRWSVLHTGRGLAAFRQAARGQGSAAECAITVEAYSKGRRQFSRVFHPDGTLSEAMEGRGDRPLTPTPIELPAQIAPAILCTGATLLRRALESIEAARVIPETKAPPAAIEPLPREAVRESRVRPSVLQEAELALLGLDGDLPSVEVKAATKWRLVGLNGPLAGQVLPLGTTPVVIGRDPAADIRLDNETVSRRHAELRPTDQGWIIEDLSSVNGTWIAGNRIQGPVLFAGSEHFRLGECTFRLERG